MSVIVPMEMPKSCYSEDEFCPFHTFVFDLNGGKNICTQLEKTASRDKRLEDCPLIELPSHGRLWDMDKVLDALQERMKIYEEMGFKDDSQEIQELIHIQADLIATVPTVLEASK